MADVVRRLRRPEYTGENRCLPCTVVNTVIAVVLALATLAVGSVLEATAVGAALALVVIVVAAGAIYFRGYLVPGTPTLTKRYFPPWLLDLFGKQEAAASTGVGDDDSTVDVDPEQLLTAAGAVEPCMDGDDLCLTASFQRAWRESLAETRDGETDRERLIEVLDAESLDLTFREHGKAFVARAEGRRVGRWVSHAAYIADVAAAPVLADRLDAWEEMSVPERGRLLKALRLFLETCPNCEADLELATETVESCCSTREVAALSCDACGARLFESDPL